MASSILELRIRKNLPSNHLTAKKLSGTICWTLFLSLVNKEREGGRLKKQRRFMQMAQALYDGEAT